MKLVPILAILAIIIRCLFPFIIHGKVDRQFLDQAFYVLDSVLFTIIGLLLQTHVKKQKDHCQRIIKCGVWFCYSLPLVLMGYGFLPNSISAHMVGFCYLYFLLWGCIGFILIIYYIFCARGDLL